MSAALPDLPEQPLSTEMTPEEVVSTLRRISYNRLLSGRAAVEAGYAQAVHPSITRDVEVLDAAALVLEILLPIWPDVRAMVRRRRFDTRGGRPS